MSTLRMPKGFAILSYYCHNPVITQIHTTVYEKFYGKNYKGKDDPRNKIISKEEALSTINDLNLTLVVNNKHGKVWE